MSPNSWPNLDVLNDPDDIWLNLAVQPTEDQLVYPNGNDIVFKVHCETGWEIEGMQGWGCNVVQQGKSVVCMKSNCERWPAVEIWMKKMEGDGYEAGYDTNTDMQEDQRYTTYRK